MDKSLEIPYVCLKELIEKSEQYLKEFLEKEPEYKDFNIVTTALFRRIIGLSKKIIINTNNGITEGIELDYRGLFETFLGFVYIFKGYETSYETVVERIRSYMVNHHKMLLKTAEKSLGNGDFSVFSEERFSTLIREQKEILNSAELKYLSDIYKKKTNGNKTPNWFSLTSEYASFNKLAEYIGKGIGAGESMRNLYSTLSQESHGQNCLLAINDIGNTFEMKTPLETTLENAIETNVSIINLTRVMLLKSSDIFNEFVFIENQEEHQKFKEMYLKVSAHAE